MITRADCSVMLRRMIECRICHQVDWYAPPDNMWLDDSLVCPKCFNELHSIREVKP